MKPLQVGGLVLVILAIIAFISAIAPLWSRIVVLGLGLIVLVAGRSGKTG